jgi:U2-associated protein SR140
VDGTPVPRKVARLHLICDILHNSAASVPSAWKFRQEFQSRLGIVFDHLANIYHSFPGRITAETFKKQITAVVDIWEDWIVFSPDFTSELRTRLDGTSVTEKDSERETSLSEMEGAAPAVTSRFKSSSFRPAHESADTRSDSAKSDGAPMDEGSDDVDGEPVDDMDGEPLNDNVDGVPVDDVDGVPMDDLDGAPMEDVDGEPMVEDNVDGIPIDDVDGAPVDV